jgi:hypothetical protein
MVRVQPRASLFSGADIMSHELHQPQPPTTESATGSPVGGPSAELPVPIAAESAAESELEPESAAAWFHREFIKLKAEAAAFIAERNRQEAAARSRRFRWQSGSTPPPADQEGQP